MRMAEITNEVGEDGAVLYSVTLPLRGCGHVLKCPDLVPLRWRAVSLVACWKCSTIEP